MNTNFDLLNDQAIENLMFPIEVSYFSYFGGKKKHWKKQVPWKISHQLLHGNSAVLTARPMEASSSSISRNLPGMTLEAYFQAQEEKMEKKITTPGILRGWFSGCLMDVECVLVVI